MTDTDTNQDINHQKQVEQVPETQVISDASSESEKNNYQVGQLLTYVKVRFPGNAKSFSFLIGKRKLNYGQKVVAMSDRGMAVGYINSFPYQVPYSKNLDPVLYINKVARDEDLQAQKELYKKEKSYETLCKDLVTKHQLDMNLTHVEFTQYGKKVVFYFTAPARVDFRALVKDLVTELKVRIELRQISVRDRSAAVGGIGPCGRQLCCSSFLNKYGVVNVKMAKEQDLTLNYSKLNGVCGQLKCCLKYEEDVYKEKRKKLPKENEFITTHDGEIGKVTKLHILSEQFDLLTDKGVIKRYVSDFFKDKAPEDYQFPRYFENISNETSQVIGLKDRLAQQTKEFEQDIIKLRAQAKDYATETFEELTGMTSLNLSSPIHGIQQKDEVHYHLDENKSTPLVEKKSRIIPAPTTPSTIEAPETQERSQHHTTNKQEDHSQTNTKKRPRHNSRRHHSRRNDKKNSKDR